MSVSFDYLDLYAEADALINRMPTDTMKPCHEYTKNNHEPESGLDMDSLPFILPEDYCTQDFLPIFCDLLDLCIEYNDSVQVR